MRDLPPTGSSSTPSRIRPVRAYHLILTCYGFWLPNDPRGSGSDHVWSRALKDFGPATEVTTSQSVASRPHDRSLRLAAKRSLDRPPVRLDGRQARCVALAFGHHLGVVDTRCLACCVMPDHAHLVICRNERTVERAATGLKAASTRALVQEELHPFDAVEGMHPKIWARGCRHRFLFDEQDITRSVAYVRDNPVKIGMRRQSWSFVEKR